MGETKNLYKGAGKSKKDPISVKKRPQRGEQGPRYGEKGLNKDKKNSIRRQRPP